ncbi:hypothetical protein BDQ17DRAFT_1404701 [Cyathus striatus]|nr:hypothetical protein BDQ17DRAFT_1404701 [Cyathus striatus]
MPAAPSTQTLLNTTTSFFTSLSTNTSPLALLSYFSAVIPPRIQHCPSTCPHPSASLLYGSNAVRSYFDLVATHWVRTAMSLTSMTPDPDFNKRRVHVRGSVQWMWRGSGRRWTEDFSCLVEFDEGMKIIAFLIKTESAPETCVMRAVDRDMTGEKNSCATSGKTITGPAPKIGAMQSSVSSRGPRATSTGSKFGDAPSPYLFPMPDLPLLTPPPTWRSSLSHIRRVERAGSSQEKVHHEAVAVPHTLALSEILMSPADLIIILFTHVHTSDSKLNSISVTPYA